jgi:hypothetical protein
MVFLVSRGIMNIRWQYTVSDLCALQYSGDLPASHARRRASRERLTGLLPLFSFWRSALPPTVPFCRM